MTAHRPPNILFRLSVRFRCDGYGSAPGPYSPRCSVIVPFFVFVCFIRLPTDS